MRFIESKHTEYKRELAESLEKEVDEEGFIQTDLSQPELVSDGGVNGGVNEGVNRVLAYIKKHPLCRVPAIALGTGIPEKSVERHVKNLRVLKKIEFTGAPKTGGYRLITDE